ncbi:unnamed protein product [Closterium sp. Naga37s-1]|nr:unnamed protein product [Closterium sp. Naga37s-1]
MGCCLSKPDVLGASQSGAAPAKAQKGSVVDGEAQADKAEAGKTVKAIDGLAGAAAGAVAGGEEAMADAEEFADAQSAADVDDDFKSAGAESLSSVSCLSYQIESLQPSTPSARKNLDFPSPSAQPSGGEKAAEGGIAGEDGKGVVVAVGEGEGGEETGKRRGKSGGRGGIDGVFERGGAGGRRDHELPERRGQARRARGRGALHVGGDGAVGEEGGGRGEGGGRCDEGKRGSEGWGGGGRESGRELAEAGEGGGEGDVLPQAEAKKREGGRQQRTRGG